MFSVCSGLVSVVPALHLVEAVQPGEDQHFTRAWGKLGQKNEGRITFGSNHLAQTENYHLLASTNCLDTDLEDKRRRGSRGEYGRFTQ